MIDGDILLDLAKLRQADLLEERVREAFADRAEAAELARAGRGGDSLALGLRLALARQLHALAARLEEGWAAG